MASSSIFYECESDLDLGFVEDAPAWLLASRFFHSKVGGRPSWLDLKNLPESQEFLCEFCQKPRVLCLQIYAPIEEKSSCFHRTLFIFMCTSPECHTDSKSPFLVLRSQLARNNEFYPYESPVESQDWKSDLNAFKYVKICRVCGCPGDKKCSGCDQVYYCSREHQMADWKFQHKRECKSEKFTYQYKEDEVCHDLLLKQSMLVIEGDDEVVSDSDDDDTEEVNIDKELEKMKELQNGVSLSGKDLKEFVEEEEVKDKNYKRFSKVVKCAPDQVLRYQKNATPLWISTQNVPQDNDIPNCPYCGSKRVFEFQIMPQLLHVLKLDKNPDEPSVDWGILAVYTCENSCDQGPAYRKEFIWKQMIE